MRRYLIRCEVAFCELFSPHLFAPLQAGVEFIKDRTSDATATSLPKPILHAALSLIRDKKKVFPTGTKAVNQLQKILTRSAKVDGIISNGKENSPDVAVLGPLLDDETLPDLIGSG